MRIALLDTTVPDTISSMARYRDLLLSAYRRYTPQVDVQVHYLGCNQQQLDKVPSRFRSWYRHWTINRSAKQSQLSGYDVLHLLDGSFGYVVDAIDHPAMMVTVHDIIPRLQMDGYFDGAPKVGRPARWLIRRAMRGVSHASVVCSVSQSTANDLKHHTGATGMLVKVVPNPIEPDLFAQVPGENQTDNGSDESTRYILHVGNNGFYKNRAGVIEIFGRLAEQAQVRLVMVGPAPNQVIQTASEQSGCQDRIDFVVDPDQSTLAKIYRNASLFLFPSRYEGFGWPPLEAMSVGCPVVCSDAGSLAEVVGDAGVVVDEGKVDAFVAACKTVLDEPGFAKQLAEKGRRRVADFSCERFAISMLELAELAQTKTITRLQPKERP